MALMVLDVDHLHDLNATFGWLRGSQVLKQSFLAIQKKIGDYGQVFRCGHGADEFIILFPGMSCREAWKLFWDEEAGCGRMRFRATLTYGTGELTRAEIRIVTLSGGVTDYIQGEKLDSLETSATFARALWGVQQAKTKGRDLIWRVRTGQRIDESPRKFVVTR